MSRIIAAAVVVLFPLVVFAQPCIPSWGTQFPAGDFDGSVRASVNYNDGTGTALYVAGSFSHAGGTHAQGVAKWTGTGWASVGADFDGDVNALLVHTDGSLYAGGWFSNVGQTTTGSIARWNGTAWVAAANNMIHGRVQALTTFPDYSGTPRVWAGGSYLTIAPGFGSGFVARLDNPTWNFPGNSNSFLMTMRAFGVYTEAGVTHLFAAGQDANYPPQGNILHWLNNSTWSPVGTGVNGPINALGTFDDGTGTALYAGGEFTAAGGQPANRIARWNGTTWSAVGSGSDHIIYSLAGFDPDSNGPLPFSIFAGGANTTPDNAPARALNYWNGSTWTPLGSGTNERILTLSPFDLSRSLFIGGAFSSANDIPASRATYFSNTTGWHIMSNPDGGNSPSDLVNAVALFDDDGPGPHPAKLYIGGEFHRFGSVEANYIAVWDGSSWAPLPTELNGPVETLQVFDDGSGPALYVAGRFSSAGSIAAANVARWKGASWSALGAGLNLSVHALAVHALPGGAANIYAGGDFSASGTTPMACVSRWDGHQWNALGSGIQAISVYALASFTDSSGPRLFVSGAMEGNSPMFAWNGSTWTNVSSGLSFFGLTYAFAVYDGGQGAALYAGGNGLSPTGTSSIAKWTGANWTFPTDSPQGGITSLTTFDDGSGPALYAGGQFTTLATGQPALHLARFNGSAWTNANSSIDHTVSSWIQTLVPFNGALYVGGRFNSNGGISSGNLAVLNPCGCYANCDQSTSPPILNANDFQCFLNKFAAAAPYANCDQSTAAPVLNVNDFQCFLNSYAVGCH